MCYDPVEELTADGLAKFLQMSVQSLSPQGTPALLTSLCSQESPVFSEGQWSTKTSRLMTSRIK